MGSSVLGPEVLSSRHFLQRTQSCATLMAAAAPVLKWLATAGGSGFTFAIADPGLCMLEIASAGGDQPPGLVIGAVWDTANVGATAFERAIRSSAPALLRGSAHPWNALHAWATLAAPVAGDDGEPVGVLLAWGPDTAVGDHTLGMVGAGALAVETALRSRAAAEELQTLQKFQSAIVESVSDGLVTVDITGTVIYMNPAAGRILGLDHKAVRGRPIRDVVGFRPVIMDALRSGEAYVDREFILRDAGRTFHFIKTATPIRDENGCIIGAVDTFREIQRVRQMVNHLTGAQARFTFDDFIGQSTALKETLDLAKVAARSASNVLIMGESGTGKEMLAQAIHNASPVADGPFVAVNCGAIPRDLIEGELFGAEEGAFTGAPKGGRPGKFELANGGTIFLDEIGDMPLEMQVKLLRVLQDRRVTRLGGKHEMEISVRVVAATNHDLARDVHEGTFRRDLYYRLHVLAIQIPPLNERLDDLPLLVQWLLKRLSSKLSKHIVGVTPEAMEALAHYDWAGNVRELENVLERAVNVAEGERITLWDLHLRKGAPQSGLRPAVHLQTMREVEEGAVLGAVATCNGNIAQAARLLGCSRNTVYAKLRAVKSR